MRQGAIGDAQFLHHAHEVVVEPDRPRRRVQIRKPVERSNRETPLAQHAGQCRPRRTEPDDHHVNMLHLAASTHFVTLWIFLPIAPGREVRRI
jgi:hypothetical protein